MEIEHFVEKDAADLVTICRRAPLKNMDEAAAVNNLLERFVNFVEAHQAGILPGDKFEPGDDLIENEGRN